jgi:hypothetical protein|tara:strand:+ start:1489 stop:1653 length:165 start_codon:yes stop_codon:yes gene_type:complete
MNAILVIVSFLIGMAGIGYSMYLPYDSELGETVLTFSAVLVAIPILIFWKGNDL